MKLNLGCGSSIKTGMVNVDIVKIKGAVRHDLNKVPYPFKTNTFSEIIAHHVLEHLSNLDEVMTELWRISKNGCRIRIVSPHALNMIYFGDPSHKTPVCYRTFDRFDINNKFINKFLTNFGSPARFKYVKRRIVMSEHFKPLNVLNPLINLFPRIYERLLVFIIPAEIIMIELEVVK